MSILSNMEVLTLKEFQSLKVSDPGRIIPHHFKGFDSGLLKNTDEYSQAKRPRL